MDFSKVITDNFFTQCVNLIGSETNKKKIKSQIIDPIFEYFKYKVRILFILVIIVLICLLVSNIVIIVYVFMIHHRLIVSMIS